MNKKELVSKLKEMNIKVVGGMVKKSDIKRVLATLEHDNEIRILEEYAPLYEELLSKLARDLNNKKYQDPKTGEILSVFKDVILGTILEIRREMTTALTALKEIEAAFKF